MLLRALLVTALFASSIARAEPSAQDATGAFWALGSLELVSLGGTLAIAIPAATTPPEQRNPMDLVLGVFVVTTAGVLAPAISAPVAQATNAPVEPALIVDAGFSGGIPFALLGSAIGTAAGDSGWGAVIGGIAGFAGGVSWSAARLDLLSHAPRVGTEAHLLAWLPVGASALAAAICTFAGADDLVMRVVAGIAGTVALGVAISAAEVAIAQP